MYKNTRSKAWKRWSTICQYYYYYSSSSEI